MSAVIELDKVTKRYGSSRGVEELSLTISPGTIFGFLGPNGAGKTTTISMLIDVTHPTSGSISIFGLDAHRDSLAIRQRVGFLAGDFALDNNLTGWQQLEYFGSLRGRFDKTYIRELAQRLDCNLDKKFHDLSRGNRQKVGLISALMHKPELLIFDEPTSGLDPLVQAEFNKIILEHQNQGGTTFMSSHTLSEVQALCQEVGFIREGELVAIKDLKELTEASAKHIKVVTDDKKLVVALTKLQGIKSLVHQANALLFTVSGDINPVLALLGRHTVHDVTITEADLETIFMQYYEGDGGV